MRWMAIVGLGAALGACTDKEPVGDLEHPELEDSDPPVETRDTGGGDAPDPAAIPTDIDEPCWNWMMHDDGPDGEVDYVALSIYEPTMFVLTSVDYDFDLDGEVDISRRYEYDAAGLVTGLYADDDGDGVFERVELVTYDANGDYATYTLDEDGDGDIEEAWSYVFEGGLRRRTDIDYGDDGTVDDRYDYTYDDADRLIAVVGDLGLDGTIEVTATYTYVDATGPDRTYEVDLDGDGVIDEVATSRYDAAGNTLFVDEEDRVAGTRSVSNYTYRADGTQETWSLEYSEVGEPVFDLVETTAWLTPEMRESTTRVHGLNLVSLDDYVKSYAWSCTR